jgi:hypothetical protein
MPLSRLFQSSILVVSSLTLTVTGLAQKKNAAVPQWEYAYLQVCLTANLPNGKSRLEEMGDQGWELVGISDSTCYFKRPKREGGYPAPAAETPKPSAPKCSLTPAQAPVIRGLRLGMSLREVLALFPVSRYNTGINHSIEQAEKIPEVGEWRFNLSLNQYPEGESRFAGIGQVELVMFDRRLVSFTVHYRHDREAAWTQEGWVRRLAEAFKLPGYENWEKSWHASLSCDGLKIEASHNFPQLTLTDPSYLAEIKRRAAAVAEKKQGEFRP